jgi:hypothetical protein
MERIVNPIDAPKAVEMSRADVWAMTGGNPQAFLAIMATQLTSQMPEAPAGEAAPAEVAEPKPAWDWEIGDQELL